MVTFVHGETNITTACQNKCVSCNHFIPIQEPGFIDPAILERDLTKAAKIMRFDVYNLVGGEPMLHPDILELIGIVRRSGITDWMEITTNGQNYRQWTDEIYQAVDEFIITPYKLTDDDMYYISEKCREFKVKLQFHPVIFTWCAYKQEHSAEHAKALYRSCWYNVNRHVIDNGYFYRCCIAPFIPELLLGLDKEHDAISLDGLTEQGLLNYLSQKETPESCRVCASNCGARVHWHETTREDWLSESLG